MAVKKLTANNDNWLGKINDESIDALAGDDTLDGSGGNDALISGTGNDLTAGGAGNDTLNGNDGNDVLDGGTGNDKLYGDGGDDFVYGGTGKDNLNGNAGNDYLAGGSDDDSLYGGVGTDVLEGGDGNDVLADTDNSNQYGANNKENDELIGGAGDDSFYAGYDLLWGNTGNDTFNINHQATVHGGIGDDKITVINTDAKLGSWLEGNVGNDTIVGGAGNDTLIAGYGIDRLDGGSGNDSYVLTFDNLETDVIRDKSGNDTVNYIRDFKVDGRDDEIDVETAVELDPPTSPAYNYTVNLPAGIENGVLDDQIYVNLPNTYSYIITWLIGNDSANLLQGDSLYDVLEGAGGNDTINSGDGDDTIIAGDGVDVINGGAGHDWIVSISHVDLTKAKNVENVDLVDYITIGFDDKTGFPILKDTGSLNAAGNEADNILMGNKFANQLTGNDGNDVLDSWFYSTFYSPVTDSSKTTGNDTLTGGAGNDTYRIDSGNDIIMESASTTGGTDWVEFAKNTSLTDSYNLPNGVENLRMLGNLKKGIGNNLNNHIIGDDSLGNVLKGSYGDDTLDGGKSSTSSLSWDSLEGGYGDDLYLVDNVNEVITELAGQGNDWVQSAAINLDLSAQGNWGDIENARLTGKLALNVTGRETDNYLIGNDGNNTLDGRNGKDTLSGGLGDDTYVVDSTTDNLVEVSNTLDTAGKIKAGWIDTVSSSVNFDLSKLLSFENLTLTATKAVEGTGNINDNLLAGSGANNKLVGLNGNDTLDGAAGSDTLIGGDGNDTYRISTDGDSVIEAVAQGTDTIEIKSTYSLAKLPNVENLLLTDVNPVDGTGNNIANVLIGNSASNKLLGLAGNDSLVAGEGADILTGGAGADVLDLSESKPSSDKALINAGDSLANISEADTIKKFDLGKDSKTYDLLDLPVAIKVAADTNTTIDGKDAGAIKYHQITDGLVKFSATSSISISSSNLSNALDYLKANITDKSVVAFQASSDVWVFQDNGEIDTAVGLIGIGTIVGLETNAAAWASKVLHIA